MIAWGYFVELFLATLILGLLLLVFGKSEVATFTKSANQEAGALFTLLFPLIFASGFALLLQKSDTSFGKWLHARGAFSVFLNAFYFYLFVATIFGIVLFFGRKYPGLEIITALVSIYATICFWGFLANIKEFISLNMEFHRIEDELKSEIK